MKARACAFGAAAIVMLLASACGDDSRSATPATTAAPATTATTATTAAAPAEVTIDGFEYGFAAPSSVAAGQTTIHFHNTGKEAHEMILARLNDGVTVDQALAAEDPSTVVSGLQTVNAAPGASADVSADLGAGTWVVVCFLPAADGQPHVAHGMLTTFTVA